MKVFEYFPPHSKCPICQTSEEGQSVLIIVDGTSDEAGISDAIPFHLKCLNLKYFPGKHIIAQKWDVK